MIWGSMNSKTSVQRWKSCAVSGLRLPRKKWNTGWQKQRSGSSSGNLLTHSQKDASPRPRVIPDPTINRLHATAPPPKGTRLYADVTGCSRYCTLLRVDLFNRLCVPKTSSELLTSQTCRIEFAPLPPVERPPCCCRSAAAPFSSDLEA